MYALFKDGKQISKAHSTLEAVWAEAQEIGAISKSRFGVIMTDNYEIKEVPTPNNGG